MSAAASPIRRLAVRRATARCAKTAAPQNMSSASVRAAVSFAERPSNGAVVSFISAVPPIGKRLYMS